MKFKNGEVIEKKTGLSTYNYGTLMREGKLSSRLLLSNLVRNEETRPKVIVLCWVPFSLAVLASPMGHLEYTYSHGNVRLLIEEFGFWGWVRSQIPTLRHQAFLRSLARERKWPTQEDLEGVERAVAGLDEGVQRLGPLVTLHLAAVELELDRGQHDRALARIEALRRVARRRWRRTR